MPDKVSPGWMTYSAAAGRAAVTDTAAARTAAPVTWVNLLAVRMFA